jgi:hypothetical protein
MCGVNLPLPVTILQMLHRRWARISSFLLGIRYIGFRANGQASSGRRTQEPARAFPDDLHQFSKPVRKIAIGRLGFWRRRSRKPYRAFRHKLRMDRILSREDDISMSP